MRESLVLDSMSGDPMPKPYSGDLRARVIGDIVSGASRRAAAEYYGISPSVVVIWAQRFRNNRKRCRKAKWRKHFAAGKARGIPARAHRQAAGLDAGRDRCGDEQARHPGQPQRGLAVLRPTQHQLQKKLCTRRSKSARTLPTPAGAGCASKACLIRRGWCSLTKPARTQRWFGCAAALGVASGSLTTRRMDIGRQSPSWPAYAIAG